MSRNQLICRQVPLSAMETVMLAEGVAEEGLKPFYKPMIPNSAFTPSKSGAERDELLISVDMVFSDN